MIDGSECRCGFRTIAQRETCPRCGKGMAPKRFVETGKVLSYTRLQLPPEGFDVPLDLALVELDNGPKLICWTDRSLEIDDRVRVYTGSGLLRCAPLSPAGPI